MRETDHRVHALAVDVVVAHHEPPARFQNAMDRPHETVETVGRRVVEPDVVGNELDTRGRDAAAVEFGIARHVDVGADLADLPALDDVLRGIDRRSVVHHVDRPPHVDLRA